MDISRISDMGNTMAPPSGLGSEWRSAPATREIGSTELLRGGREVIIRHAGQTYRLRHTRNDKLILTK